MYNHEADKFTEAIGVSDEQLKKFHVMVHKKILANFTAPLKRSERVEGINKFLSRNKFTKKEYAILFALSLEIAAAMFSEKHLLPIELKKQLLEKSAQFIDMQDSVSDDISIQ